MPQDDIVGKKARYYIASYNADASVLENLVGKHGTIESLHVDGGGLRAPKGSYENQHLFKNYSPETKKVLHAKVIFLADGEIATLSLWTGNLRAPAYRDQENVIVTTRLPQKAHQQVLLKWFEKPSAAGHLIISFEGSSVRHVSFQTDDMWRSFAHALSRFKTASRSSLVCHVFSPWGSTKFVAQLVTTIGKDNIAKLCLYTRCPSPNDTHMWVDWADKDHKLAIERRVRKDGSKFKFPHQKCLFLTERQGNRDDLIWAYIGSANFTEAALFKRTNVEFAAFFSNISKNTDIKTLFTALKRTAQWKEREPPRKTQKRLDESPKANETDDNGDDDNFATRRLAKLLCKKLQTKAWQKKLEDAYESNTDTYNTKLSLAAKPCCCTIQVTSVLPATFDLRVESKTLGSFALSVARHSRRELLASSDIDQKFAELDAFTSATSSASRRKRSQGNGSGIAHPNINIRFPIEKVILEDLVDEKLKIVRQLENQNLDRFQDSERRRMKLAIWSHILRAMG